MKETIRNLRDHGFEVIPVSSATEALETAKKFFTGVRSVGLGGSTTVQQIGLLSWLREQTGFQLFDQYEEDISMEENVERRRKGLLADIYVTSSNAITRTGYLVNVDGSGNRVAAQAYGPKKVLLIVGKNKIVPDVEAGFRRVEEVVAPKNVERVNKKAFSLKKEQRYTVQNIQSVFVVIKKSDNKERIKIILVDKPLGF
jgi:L-lactate utilization protein LutC